MTLTRSNTKRSVPSLKKEKKEKGGKGKKRRIQNKSNIINEMTNNKKSPYPELLCSHCELTKLQQRLSSHSNRQYVRESIHPFKNKTKTRFKMRSQSNKMIFEHNFEQLKQKLKKLKKFYLPNSKRPHWHYGPTKQKQHLCDHAHRQHVRDYSDT